MNKIGSAVLLGLLGMASGSAVAGDSGVASTAVPPQPIVLAQGATPQFDYILKQCKETLSVGDSRSAMRAVDPAGMLAVYLERNNEAQYQYIDLKAIKTTLLEDTKHGEIISGTTNTGRTAYRYDAEPEYVGNDQAVFLAEFEGKRYKIVIELHVFNDTPPSEFGNSTCPAPRLIKVTKPARPSSGASGYDLNPTNVSISDLAGAGVGRSNTTSS